MRSCLFALVLLTAVGAAAQTPQTSAIDTEIAFLEARVGRDEADAITPTRLGHAYLRRAKATGTFADYGKAETAFRQALTRQAEHVGALTGLATALSARHAFEEAYAVGQRAIAANPDSADGYAVAGDAALETSRLAEAAKLYARVAQLAPGYHAETRAANLAAAEGNIQSAYAALRRAAADAAARGLDADLRAWPHVRSGALAFDHGDWTRAERSYQAALKITPDSEVAIEHLAELRAAQGRHRQALELYRRAVALNPRPEYEAALGAVYAALDQSKPTQAAYNKAREGLLAAAAAGDPGAYRELALFFADVEGNGAEAVKWARKDLEIRTDPATLSVLAWALLKNGEVEEAARTATRAADGKPVDPLTWYRVGVVAQEAGDAAVAKTRLARAVQLNPRLKTRSPRPRGRG